MLVLSRKIGEKVLIPELAISITVLEIRGDRVRLGIEAPNDVAVHRHEVWQRINEFAELPTSSEPALARC